MLCQMNFVPLNTSIFKLKLKTRYLKFAFQCFLFYFLCAFEWILNLLCNVLFKWYEIQLIDMPISSSVYHMCARQYIVVNDTPMTPLFTWCIGKQPSSIKFMLPQAHDCSTLIFSNTCTLPHADWLKWLFTSIGQFNMRCYGWTKKPIPMRPRYVA